MKKLILSLAALGACSLAFAETLATVNGEKIDSSYIDKQVKILTSDPTPAVKDTPELREELLAQAIHNEIFKQAAVKRGVDKTEGYKAKLKEIEKESKKQGLDKQPFFKERLEFTRGGLLAAELVRSLIESAKPTEKEIADEYKKYADFYKGTKKATFREIVVKDDAMAGLVYKDLKAGKPFADVLQDRSIDPRKEQLKNDDNLPSLNFADVKALDPKLHDLLVKLKPGEYNKVPYQAGGDLHIFGVVSVSDAEIVPLDKYKDTITMMLKEQMAEKQMRNIGSAAKVEFKNSAMPAAAKAVVPAALANGKAEAKPAATNKDAKKADKPAADKAAKAEKAEQADKPVKADRADKAEKKAAEPGANEAKKETAAPAAAEKKADAPAKGEKKDNAASAK